MTVKKSCKVDDKMLISRLGFSTFKAKIAFTQLRKIFTKAPILYHFKSD